MPSINDLKTSDTYTGNGTASGTEDGGVMDFGSVNKKKSDNAPLNLGSVNTRRIKKSDDDDFTAPKRKIADLSSLPERELMGVEIKKSIDDDIFKAGGDFEQARNKKIQEFMEVNELIDAHNAEVAANLGIDVPSDEELQEIGQKDMTPAIIGTKYYDQADAYGRAQGKMKSSPLEERAKAEGKTIDQYISGEDVPKTTIIDEDGNKKEVVADISDSTNEIEEEEYMDEMEKELNEEFDATPTVKIINTDDKKEEETTPEVEAVEEEVVIEDTNESDETTDVVDDIPEIKETPKAEEKKEEVPKVDVAKPKEKVKTSEDKLGDAITDPNVGIDVDFNIDDEDMEDLDMGSDDSDESIEEISAEESLKNFQAAISEKIKPVAQKLDLSSFTVMNKAIPLSPKVLNTEKVAMSWALPNSNQYIAMTEFSGKELEQLNDNSGTNRYQTIKNRYKLFFDHIVSPKPDDVETWAKTISYADDKHLFFAVYGANFAGSNFIPYDCPDCKNTFLSENIPLEDMYKFDNDEAKEKFLKIKDTQESMPAGLYASEITQISDNIAIGFKDPSIYDTLFETTLLNEEFLNKYRELIAVISYIDNIYYIDPVSKTLSPIDYKVDKNNKVKTIKARIITYARILKNLAPDQYYIILSYLNAVATKNVDIKYVKPEVTCPHCGRVIEEQEVEADSLVFTRAQLASLTLTSIN